MVGATPSQAALSETRTDAELIAEIAPAMLAKLRLDGSARGTATAVALLLALQAIYWPIVAQQNLKPFADRADLLPYCFGGLGIVVVLQIALPHVFKRRNVLNEVRYRRQHGKWRWER
jgi:hypothetical protein